MAVVSPILLGMVFGIIEYGWVFMVQSNITNAARDACRAGVLPGANDATIQQEFQTAVKPAGLTNADYTLQITHTTGSNNIETIKVTVRVPWAKASLVGGGILPDPRELVNLFGGGRSSSARTTDLVASCSMMREQT